MRSSTRPVSVTGEAGFSLLEVVISLAILMTLLIAVSSLLVTSFKVGANSRYRQAATEIATSNLDYQVQVGSTTLVGEVGDTSLSTVTSGGQTYVSEMEISPYTSSNASSCANPNGGLAMLKITVWVTWANVTRGPPGGCRVARRRPGCWSRRPPSWPCPPPPSTATTAPSWSTSPA
jgi:type II secretory pathway pseudopilin PulG